MPENALVMMLIQSESIELGWALKLGRKRKASSSTSLSTAVATSAVGQGKHSLGMFQTKLVPQEKGLEQLKLELGAGAGTGRLWMTRVARQCGTSGKVGSQTRDSNPDAANEASSDNWKLCK